MVCIFGLQPMGCELGEPHFVWQKLWGGTRQCVAAHVMFAQWFGNREGEIRINYLRNGLFRWRGSNCRR